MALTWREKEEREALSFTSRHYALRCRAGEASPRIDPVRQAFLPHWATSKTPPMVKYTILCTAKGKNSNITVRYHSYMIHSNQT